MYNILVKSHSLTAWPWLSNPQAWPKAVAGLDFGPAWPGSRPEAGPSTALTQRPGHNLMLQSSLPCQVHPAHC